MRVLIGSAFGALALLSGGATQAASVVPAAFEFMFPIPAADTLDSIAKGCVRDDETVTSPDGDAVTCEFPMGRPERIAARIVLREPFIPSPRAFVRFAVMSSGSATSTVQVSGWVEDTRAPADRRRTSMAGGRFDARLQAFLLSLGGHPRTS